MRTTRTMALILALFGLVVSSCVFGSLIGLEPTPTPIGISGVAATPEIPGSQLESTPTPPVSPTPLPTIFLTMFVNQYDTFRVFRREALWRSAITGTRLSTEDFEQEVADFGKLPNPYLTANGFLLTGKTSSAQILRDPHLLPTGNFLLFRDFGDGLTFVFPNQQPVSAFGFDYRASEDWILRLNETAVPLQGGRAGFVGVVLDAARSTEFTLSSNAEAQGGLAIDNISYIPAVVP